MTDKELLAKCLNPATREQGYMDLISKFKDRVYWQIRKIVQHHDDAEEVMQNVWIKVWKNLDRFQGKSALSTWLYRIAYNESISYIQSIKKQKLVDWENIEPTLDSDSGESMFDNSKFDRDEVMHLVENAVQNLPDKQKLIFHYRYNEELPYSQISEITGTSEGALKASFHHAVKKIQDYVKKNLNP